MGEEEAPKGLQKGLQQGVELGLTLEPYALQNDIVVQRVKTIPQRK